MKRLSACEKVSGALLSLVQAFSRDLEGVLGGNLIGVILFGSQARGEAGPESDVDIAIIAADASTPDVLANLSQVALQQSPLRCSPVALSFETYGRIKTLCETGDPFALVILAEGVFLSDRDGLLARLRTIYSRSDRLLDSRTVADHLTRKAEVHIERAAAAIQESLAQLQLAGMAIGQALAFDGAESLTPSVIGATCRWKGLGEKLRHAGMTADQLSVFEQVINAQKSCRASGNNYPGREVVERLAELKAFIRPKAATVAA